MELHTSQVSFFKPILDGAQDSGISINRLLKDSGLNKFNLDDFDNYVPINSMYAFFAAISEQQGIADLTEQFANQIQLTSLSQWGEMVAYAPNVLAACQLAVKYDNVINSHERAGFEINGTKATYWQRFIDKPTVGLSVGRKQADYISFVLALNGFRLAGGADWAPLEIHLQSDTSTNFDTLLPVGNNTKILLNQPRTAIIFPTSMLTKPMLSSEGANDIIINHHATDLSLVNTIERLIDSRQTGLVPNMKLIAEMTESSTRTLQRNLSKEGSSISEVVDQWRFKTALKLIEEPGNNLKEISERLSYSNLPNFERAFRRWTKTSPGRYREML